MEMSPAPPAMLREMGPLWQRVERTSALDPTGRCVTVSAYIIAGFP